MTSPQLDENGKPKRQIILLKSVFDDRPAVILFTYTTECGATQRPLDRAVWADIDGPKLYYTLTNTEYNAVINTLRHGGLYRIKDGSSRFCVRWSINPKMELLQSLKPSQRANGFPACYHLGRKDLLWQNISRMQRRFGDAFDIIPKSYAFPMGLTKWKSDVAGKPDSLWIWKPCNQSCGRGIKVFSSNDVPEDVNKFGPKRGVIQKYVHNPLLIDGYKFDLRVYVVVLSYDPLKVYIAEEGLVRLATTKFSSDLDDLGSRTMHLTNYSVNKLSEAFVQNQDGKGTKMEDGEEEEADAAAGDDSIASKWSFSELKTYFQRKNIDYDKVFESISDVCVKTLLACEPPMKMEWARMLDGNNSWISWSGGAHPASCFQVFGFDVMLDDAMKAWLLEVNVRPSFSSGSPLDKRIKTKLIADALTLVGVKPPPGYVSRQSGLKRAFGEMADVEPDAAEESDDRIRSPEDHAATAARLAASSPQEALAMFDESAWNIVLDAYDEEMRSGGLRRIFPSNDPNLYLPYCPEETYANVVLRKWHEAGGADAFRQSRAHSLPPWVPRPVRVSRT